MSQPRLRSSDSIHLFTSTNATRFGILEFQLSVESNSRLLWFCLTSRSYWLAKLRQDANRKPIVTFPLLFSRALRRSHVFSRILIGSLCCLRLLWLVRAITFVWVLRPSVRNCSVYFKFVLVVTFLLLFSGGLPVTADTSISKYQLFWSG